METLHGSLALALERFPLPIFLVSFLFKDGENNLFIYQKVSPKEKFWFDLDSNLVEIHVINIQKTLKKAVRALKVKELWIWKHAMVVGWVLLNL